MALQKGHTRLETKGPKQGLARHRLPTQGRPLVDLEYRAQGGAVAHARLSPLSGLAIDGGPVLFQLYRLGTVLEQFQNGSRTVPERFRNGSGTVPERFLNGGCP